MIKYNLDKLVKVELCDFTLSIRYSYLKEKKLFGFVTQKEGFYLSFFHSEYIGKELPKNYTLINNSVYFKPRLIMHFQGGRTTEKVFDTFLEAENFAKELTNDRKWLTL